MNMADWIVNSFIDEVTSINEFLEKYTKNYPRIDEEGFKNHLSIMEEHFVF